jgi:multidrug efflux pump subunit AcrB
MRDVLARLDGVGDITAFGAREYSMRIWLDPEKIAARNLTASDIVQALREQNVKVAAGAQSARHPGRWALPIGCRSTPWAG